MLTTEISCKNHLCCLVNILKFYSRSSVLVPSCIISKFQNICVRLTSSFDLVVQGTKQIKQYNILAQYTLACLVIQKEIGNFYLFSFRKSFGETWNFQVF